MSMEKCCESAVADDNKPTTKPSPESSHTDTRVTIVKAAVSVYMAIAPGGQPELDAPLARKKEPQRQQLQDRHQIDNVPLH